MKKKLFNKMIAFMLLFMMIFSNLNGVIVYAADNLVSPVSFSEDESSGELEFVDLDQNVVERETAIDQNGNTVKLDKALHFIIRHWHTAEEDPSKVSYQGNGYTGSEDHYFVIGEGYIVPTENDSFNYRFYFVKNTGNEEEVSYELNDITNADDYVSNSSYITDINPVSGAITFAASPVVDDNNEPVERFSTFSIFAGHDSVEYAKDQGQFTITYDPYVHLAKVNVFYVREAIVRDGINFSTVTGTDTTEGNAEQDTIEVYTYTQEMNGFSIGDMVINPETGKPYQREDENLPENINSYAQLTKMYDTSLGLHTDKTATSIDGRTFNLDLEAWYAEGANPEVGMVLDASGSMVNASDTPEQITLTEEEIKALGINKVSKNSSVEGEFNWDNYFLTNEQLNKILNPRNTDNTQLSANAYTYYVKNGADYNPLGYWEGVESDDTAYTFIPTQDSTTTGLKIDNNKGILVSGNGASGTGIVLDAVPSSDSFTLSFNMTVDGSDDPSDNKINKLAELIYIGSLAGDTEENNYLTIYRDQGTSRNRFRANQVSGRGGTNIIDINNIFNYSKTYTVTLVFENVSKDNGTLTTYIDNSLASEHVGLTHPIDDFNIIINGIQDNYGKAAKLWINNVYVHDEVIQLNEIKQAQSERENVIGIYKFDSEYGLKNTARSNNESAVKLTQQVVFDSQNVMVPNIAQTKDGQILGSINLGVGDITTDISYSHTKAGWYFITHAGKYANHYEAVGSGKRLIGLNGTQTKDGIQGIVISDSVGKDDFIGTGFEYKNTTSDTPTKFYVDSEGNLRCFFATGANTTVACSYVYELDSDGHIRAEALQRALGLFVTQLSDVFPSSQVAATRFSTEDISDERQNELVLLDWTSDPGESADILSLQRGGDNGTEKGTALGFTESLNGIRQYNYGLTGSTSTWRGLKSYYTNLVQNNSSYIEGDEAVKFLIIFTDGQDTDRENNNKDEAKKITDQLKNEGYTIFTVLLDGSTMEEGSAEYTKAESFLVSLSGTKDTVSDSQKEKYFFSVNKGRNELGKEYENIKDADVLTHIFSENILGLIVDSLEDYTVSDYIDPRFNLVDRDGDIWHLNSDGQVTVEVKSGKEKETQLTLDKDSKVTIKISKESTSNARSPYLRYDSEKEMYYLEWTGQRIPSSAEGSTTVPIWKAQITVQAKDDFIGGNAVLTNGNDKDMNYVYHAGDKAGNLVQTIFDSSKEFGKDASSGTEDMFREEGDEYPSKGFPRVVVNVEPLEGSAIKEQTIYMGESLTSKDVVNKIIALTDQTLGNENNLSAENYVEYLGRFITYYSLSNKALPESSELNSWDYQEVKAILESNLSLNEKIELILEISKTDSGLTLPYAYLPAFNEVGEQVNNAGQDEHFDDILGTLTYKLEEKIVDNPDGEILEVENIYPGTTTDRQSRTSEITVIYNPISEENRHDAVEALVLEEKSSVKVYAWNSDYKPTDRVLSEIEYLVKPIIKTDIVSGEIRFLVQTPQSLVTNPEFNYSAVLVNANDQDDIVGTFVLNTAKNVLESDIYEAEFVFSEEYRNTGFEFITTGLPLGEYLIITNHETLPAGYRVDFEDFITENLKDFDSIFTIGSGAQEEEFLKDYAATVEDNVIKFGYDSENQPNSRFGLYMVQIKEDGNLTVNKTVVGETTDKAFNFTVTLSDETINGTFGDMSFNRGVAEITLKHGESKTAENIPANTVYTVTEAEDSDYEVTYEGNTGTILEGQTVTASFTNTKVSDDDPVIPEEPEDPPTTPEEPDVVVEDPTLIKEQAVNNASSSIGMQSVQNGDIVTYYLTVVNTTNETMTNVVITDTIPKGLVWIKDQTAPGFYYNGEKGTLTWTFSSLKEGKSATVWFSAYVRPDEETFFVNQFSVDFIENQKDIPHLSNTVVLERLEEDQTTGPDLVVKKLQQVKRNNTEGYQEPTDGQITDEYIEVREGDIITYYISVENTGDETAYDVLISDPVPEGLIFIKGSESYSEGFKQNGNQFTWSIGSLEPGDKAQVQVTFKIIVPEILEETYWRNVAYVSFDGSDILTPSNEVVIGDPPTDPEAPGFDGDDGFMIPDSTPETPDSITKPEETEKEELVDSSTTNTETTVEPTVNKTTSTTTNVTQTGVSPQTGVHVTIGLFIIVGLTALIILILMFLNNRRKKNIKDK